MTLRPTLLPTLAGVAVAIAATLFLVANAWAGEFENWPAVSSQTKVHE